MDFLVSMEGAEEGMGTVLSGGSDMAIRGETLGWQWCWGAENRCAEG